jgi:hypothetical protein
MSRNFYIQDTPIAPSIRFEESKPNGYTLVEMTNPLIDDLIKKKYNEYKKDGIEYFNNTRVQLVKARNASLLTSDNIVAIEKKLASVESSLIIGNWISAETILINDVVADALLSQDFYDKLLNDFQTYILNNY